ncbi:MAG: acyl-CoA thioesterase [Chloroflexi bacterium]|nr:acyl-CoA thioesterase [Chloroflexota bacterium]
MYLKETTTSHLVRPEDLNHHGTLFAGKMAMWFLEAGLIASSLLVGRPEDIVCVNLHGMTFKKPTNNGDIIEIKAKVILLGRQSITVNIQTFKNNETIPLIKGWITFVTVNKEGKAYDHGIKLPPEYIAENRALYEEALKIKQG